MDDLRFGVIGCGGQGNLHSSNVRFVPGARTVAYCDIDPARAERFLAKFGGAYATDDPARLIADRQLHGLLIQTGPDHHASLVAEAARAGKHVFCEKPIALTLDEALKARDAVAASGVQFVYGVCNRLAPMVLRAKSIVPDPVYTFCQCQDTITGQAVHNLDLAIHLFHTAPLRRVFAQGQDVWNLDPHLPVDSFVATLTFEDRSVHCYIQHGSSRNGTLLKYSYQLFGRDRCVFLAERFKRCIVHGAGGEVLHTMAFEGPDFTSSDDGLADVRGPHGYMGHFDEIAHWAACIRGQARPEMTADHAVRVLAVEKAILESTQSGVPIDFPGFCASHGIR